MTDKNIEVGDRVVIENDDRVDYCVKDITDGEIVVGPETVSTEDIDIPDLPTGNGSFSRPVVSDEAKKCVFAIVAKKQPIDPWDVKKYTGSTIKDSEVNDAIKLLKSEKLIYNNIEGKLVLN